jgi:hypothetical protein
MLKKDGSISSKTSLSSFKTGRYYFGRYEPISLQVSAKFDIANPRIDLVICEHKYEEIAGGQS